jgi:hypothetical protein
MSAGLTSGGRARVCRARSGVVRMPACSGPRAAHRHRGSETLRTGGARVGIAGAASATSATPSRPGSRGIPAPIRGVRYQHFPGGRAGSPHPVDRHDRQHVSQANIGQKNKSASEMTNAPTRWAPKGHRRRTVLRDFAGPAQRLPAVGQQVLDPPRRMRADSLEHVAEVERLTQTRGRLRGFLLDFGRVPSSDVPPPPLSTR